MKIFSPQAQYNMEFPMYFSGQVQSQKFQINSTIFEDIVILKIRCFDFDHNILI